MDQSGKINAAAQQEQLVQLGKLQSEEEQHNNRIKERDCLLSNLARSYQWPGHSAFPSNQPLSKQHLFNLVIYYPVWCAELIYKFNCRNLGSVQVSQYQDLLKQTVEQEKHKESVLKQELENEERRLLNSLNKLREECVRLEQDIKAKDTFLNTCQR